MKRELTPELIRRYLNGDCTPAEATEVREWYDSFENHTDPLAFLSPRERETLKRRMYDEIMLCLQTKGALSDEESSVHAGDDRLPWGGASPRTGNSPLRPVFSRRHLLRFIGGAAAVVLVLLGVRAMFETPVTSETAENCLPAPVSSAQTADTPDPAPEAGMTLVENKMKSIRREILPDGSIVWLKPNTWISFPPTFAWYKRDGKMERKAIFEV